MFNYKSGSFVVLAIIFSCFSLSAKDKDVKKGICASAIVKTDEQKLVCALAEKADAKKKDEEANKLLKSLATPSEKKAMSQVAKAEKQEREWQEKLERAFQQADVEGCENSRSVEIVPLPWQVPILRFFSGPSLTVRINNKSGETVRIDSSEIGTRVRNLCAGGSVSFYRPHVSGVDGEYVNFTLTAWGLKGASVNSQPFSVSVYQQSPNVSQVWDIPHLQK